MALHAYSAWLLADGDCSPMAPPEASHHMPCAFKNSVPSWCDQRARRALMKPLCCRHKSCRHPQFCLGMLWDPEQCCQEGQGLVPPAPVPITRLHLQYHHRQFSSQALSFHFPKEGTVQRLTVSWESAGDTGAAVAMAG